MFGTSGVRGPVGETVTAALAVRVGRAVASEGAGRVVLGRDARLTGDALADAVAAGLRECGADVVDVGRAATPTVARAVGWRDAAAGVMVTASHNPPTDNGLKLWTPSGQAYGEAARAAVADRVRADDYAFAAWDAFGEREAWSGADERHVAALVDAVDVADPPRVVVDAGNGVGGVTARALAELGCAVETLNGQPDGRFPGRPSEPTAEHCATLREVVAGTGADLGVAHDGDADRTMAVTADGSWVGGDDLLALFAAATAGPDERVAAPVNTSMAVDRTLDAAVVRTRVGDVFVAERASDPDVAFGGEPSGAWVWPAETLAPDGPLAACKLVELVAERGPLADQVARVDSFPIRRDSVPVAEADKAPVMDRVATAVRERYDDVTAVDGVRAATDDGWFLVRPSGTEPVVRVTAEADDPDRADALADDARALVADAAAAVEG
jgi:phosphoglucosamine mutase